MATWTSDKMRMWLYGTRMLFLDGTTSASSGFQFDISVYFVTW